MATYWRSILKRHVHLVDSEQQKLWDQVDKLKVLAESLANSSEKVQKRIANHRHQKEEALNFRVVKENEEDELSRSVASCKVKANVVQTWINFLDDTWKLSSSNSKMKKKHMDDELERNESHFLNLTKQHRAAYKSWDLL